MLKCKHTDNQLNTYNKLKFKSNLSIIKIMNMLCTINEIIVDLRLQSGV